MQFTLVKSERFDPEMLRQLFEDARKSLAAQPVKIEKNGLSLALGVEWVESLYAIVVAINSGMAMGRKWRDPEFAIPAKFTEIEWAKAFIDWVKLFEKEQLDYAFWPALDFNFIFSSRLKIQLAKFLGDINGIAYVGDRPHRISIEDRLESYRPNTPESDLSYVFGDTIMDHNDFAPSWHHLAMENHRLERELANRRDAGMAIWLQGVIVKAGLVLAKSDAEKRVGELDKMIDNIETMVEQAQAVMSPAHYIEPAMLSRRLELPLEDVIEGGELAEPVLAFPAALPDPGDWTTSPEDLWAMREPVNEWYDSTSSEEESSDEDMDSASDYGYEEETDELHSETDSLEASLVGF